MPKHLNLSNATVNPFLIHGKRALLIVGCMTLLGACAMLPETPAPALEPAPVKAPKSAVTEVPVAAIPTAVVPVPVVVPTPVDPKPEVAATTTAAVVAPAAQVAVVPAVVAKPEVQPTSMLARGFYINVGLFAVPTNGSNAYKKLEAAGLPVFTDVLKTKKGPLTRVRVGPFADRAQADAAVKKIQTLKLDANVFQH